MNKEFVPFDGTFIITIIILTIALMICLAQDAKAVTYEHSNSSFETVMKLKEVQSIETWQQPKTQYTPKNLRTQYQIRFNGKTDTGVGSYTMPVTDYDTRIIKSEERQDGYYIIDNLGNSYRTSTDIRPIENKVQNLQERLLETDSRINKLDNKLEGGLATVTALTGLHPNPRATEKLEVSVATGIYADNIAGAIGMFYHPNDRVQLNVGASYGGDSQFAGSCGITFSLGKKRK